MKYFIFGLILSSIFFSCKKKNILDINQNCELGKSTLENIQFFPKNYAINQDISAQSLDPNSQNIIKLIGSPGLHPDFGSGLYEGSPMGIPYVVVCGNQPLVPIEYRGNNYDDNYGDESDAGPFRIPLDAPVEGGTADGDKHVLAVDTDNLILYELYNATKTKTSWQASAGVKWDLKSIPARPKEFTSCDAAGMPILPLLVRYEEILKGEIDHAIRFTLSKSKVTKGFVSPANHKVNGTNTNPNAPVPMGLRMRLKAGYDISGFSKENQIILKAMKKYGLILTDIGSDMFVTGAPDDRWNNDDLHQLSNVKASDFEVVKMGNIE